MNRKNKNTTPHPPLVTQAMREKMQGHRACLIWLTGLPSSGKSTVAHEIDAELHRQGLHSFVLDADNIRLGLNHDLGFSPEDRAENIRRIGEVARLFVEAGIITICAFISPYRKARRSVRNLFPKGEFIEAYVSCPLEECEKRDPKGLYKRARKGKVKGFTGIDAPYETPKSPELIIETQKETIDESVAKVLDYINTKLVLNIAPES